MNQTGIYEQLITQLVAQNLDRDTFYVGERQLESAEAANKVLDTHKLITIKTKGYKN